MTAPDSRITLKLTRPKRLTLLYAAILFVAVCFGAEWFARSGFVQQYAPYQAYGTNHTQLEIQLTNLEKFSREHGAPDCFVFGSSQAFREVDTDAFAEAFTKESGESLNCYNFGITGSQVSTTSILNKILVEKYKPRLVVIGTSFLDYTEGRELQIDERFKENDWLQYQVGHLSINGWLLEKSYAWRFVTLASYAAPLSMNYTEVLREAHKWDGEIAESGFALSTVRIDPFKPVDTGFVKNIKQEFGDYGASERNLAALEAIISDCQAAGAQVVVAEMIYHPALLDLKDYHGKPRLDRVQVLAFREQINARIASIAEDYKIAFLIPGPEVVIPVDSWYDLYHLNRRGAKFFSDWLGKAVAQAVGSLPGGEAAQ